MKISGVAQRKRRRRRAATRTADGGRIPRALIAFRLAPSNRKMVREVLFERLRSLILSGSYRSGMKLREEELARAFDVSRTPVREALRMLESEGLVRYLPHRGVLVNQISRDDLGMIYPIRAVLEGLAARLAAQQITERELAILHDLHRQMQTLCEKQEYTRASRVHTRFNMQLYRASRNPRLIGILSQFNDYIEHTIARALALPGRAAEIVQEHASIIDAIAARDGGAAEMAGRRHVENARRAFAGEPREQV